MWVWLTHGDSSAALADAELLAVGSSVPGFQSRKYKNAHPFHALLGTQNQPLDLMIRKVFHIPFFNIAVTQGLFLGLQNFDSCKIIQNEFVCETSHCISHNDFLTVFLSVKESCAYHKTYRSRLLPCFNLV